MNVNGIELKTIDIRMIFPIYTESVSESAVTTRVRILVNGGELSKYPIVERDNIEEKYWLISGFLEYSAYKLYFNIRGKGFLIPVLEQAFSDSTTQRIKLLRSMFQDPSKWLDRHCLLNNLLEQGLEIKEIAKKIGVSTSLLKHYLINHELPDEIVKRAYRNRGSFINLEKIRRLNLHPFVRDNLYERAVLPLNDNNRLTTDKLQKFFWLYSIKEFRELKWQMQLDMIQKVCSYKITLVSEWEQDCLNMLNGVYI